MTTFSPSVEALRTVFRAVATTPYGCAVAVALRGPDDENGSLKDRTTAPIRGRLWFSHGNYVGYGMWNTRPFVVMTSQEAHTHFGEHVTTAAQALELSRITILQPICSVYITTAVDVSVSPTASSDDLTRLAAKVGCAPDDLIPARTITFLRSMGDVNALLATATVQPSLS